MVMGIMAVGSEFLQALCCKNQCCGSGFGFKGVPGPFPYPDPDSQPGS
jgi:hypothetical protein